ncbi:MAG TPA: two-component regulator propeller domain-containing protein [Thermoanaerobaculia bacterium]|nr:two-component regulator propeller domain-containing protein [Thermoanaerobaculia bacterium]
MRAIAVALLLAFAPAVWALSADRAISQFHHTAWTAKDGAPSQISALAQTADGFLWIGSARGLFRFDGVQFEAYTPPAGVTLPSHNIYTLMATPDGGLWVSFRPSGLGFLQDGRITVLTRPEELPPAYVNAFALDRDGRLWAGTPNGLAVRSGTRWQVMHPEWTVLTLLVDREGALWVGTTTSVFFLRRGAKEFEDGGAGRGRAAALAQGPDGTLWASDSPYKVRRLSRRPRPEDRLELVVNPSDVLVDRDGTLWMIDMSFGMTRLRHPERAPNRAIHDDDPLLEPYTERDGLSGDLANVLFEDREGNVWVGTSKGLDRFRYSHVVPVPLPGPHQKVTLAAGGDGTLWSGSAADDHLAHIRGGSVQVFDTGMFAASVYDDGRGTRWWGGYGSLLRQRNERFDRFPQPAFLPPDFAWEVVRAGSDGGLWVSAGDAGLVHFKDGVWSRPPPPAGLLARGPSATFHDSHGRIWFGYTENRVALLDGGRATVYTRDDGIDVGRIRVIRGRTGPHYWIGGELGLAVFRDGAFRSIVARDGTRFGTVSGIIETADGTLWLNEVRGIVRIAAEEARKAVADPGHRVAVQLFDFLDGMPGSPQMNFTVSTAVEDGDGLLWFATDNGLARIDPARLQRNTVPPPVVIRSVTADRAYAPAAELRFPVGTRQLEIHYTALSLSIPERVKFRYRLEGADEQWQDAGARREAFYTNLGPGTYTFRVRAANNDGVWNQDGASLAIVIPPAFHQTKWFLALCIAGAAVIVGMLYLLRVRQMTARLQRLHEERMDERTRIARELHDTLLQGFLSASMQLHVAADRIPDDSAAKPIVTNVLGLIAKVSEEGRQAVRGLRLPENTEALEQAFGRAKQELAGESELGFRVIVAGRRREVAPEVRDEIYRIGREALVNAFQHADAKNVEVEVEYLDDRLRLRVRDDGRGIDETVLRSGLDDHWGLAGMHERARKIGAQFRVISRAGAGTEIELSVPRRIAYRR